MDETRQQLIDARRLVNKLAITCRRTIVYLKGESAFDETRMRKTLHEAIAEAEKFLNV